jgi:hypothetical protein
MTCPLSVWRDPSSMSHVVGRQDILEETCSGLGSIVGTVDQTGYDPNLNTSSLVA